MSPRLLITAAGSGTAFGYALALVQTQPAVGLVTVDTNPAELVSASVFSEAHVQVEPFDPARHVVQLNALIRERGISHYLPIIDAEIRCAAVHRREIDAHVVGHEERFASFAGQKGRFGEALAPLGIESPRPWAPGLDGYPCFAKPAGGFGGRGSTVIRNEEELARVPAGFVLQEVLDGPEYTVDCFPRAGAQGNVCSVRERVEIKAGVCTKAWIAPNAALESIADRLVTHFDLQAPFCFQAMRRGDDYVVTDVNPRLGAGSQMSAANGANLFAAHLAQVFGGDPGTYLRRYRERCFVTRQYVDYLHAP